MPNEASEMV